MASMIKKAAAGAVIGGSLLFTGMGVASAQPLQLQDGLVNLAVGNVTILEDVNVGVAATVAAAICDVADVGSINVLAEAADSGTASDSVCTVPGGDVTLLQNAGTPGNSGGAGNSENSNAGGNR